MAKCASLSKYFCRDVRNMNMEELTAQNTKFQICFLNVERDWLARYFRDVLNAHRSYSENELDVFRQDLELLLKCNPVTSAKLVSKYRDVLLFKGNNVYYNSNRIEFSEANDGNVCQEGHTSKYNVNFTYTGSGPIHAYYDNFHITFEHDEEINTFKIVPIKDNGLTGDAIFLQMLKVCAYNFNSNLKSLLEYLKHIHTNLQANMNETFYQHKETQLHMLSLLIDIINQWYRFELIRAKEV